MDSTYLNAKTQPNNHTNRRTFLDMENDIATAFVLFKALDHIHDRKEMSELIYELYDALGDVLKSLNDRYRSPEFIEPAKKAA